MIPSVTEAFCGSCDRVRLYTADGQLRACLFAGRGDRPRAPMRAGASDDELAVLIEATVAGEWAGHGISEGHLLPASPPTSRSGASTRRNRRPAACVEVSVKRTFPSWC